METILVTGSSKGIGASIIKLFAKNKYNVVINYNYSKEQALKLKEFLFEEYKIDALAIKCDITNDKEVISMINIVNEKYGNIDILVNNAAYSYDDYIENKTKTSFMRVLETNIYGTFNMIKNTILYSNPKKIINISSTDSIDTYSDMNIDYSISKAAINQMTKILKDKYKNIRFYVVAPNWVKTETILEMNKEYLNEELKRINQKRLIKPIEVSNLIYDIVTTDKYDNDDIIEIRDGGLYD